MDLEDELDKERYLALEWDEIRVEEQEGRCDKGKPSQVVFSPHPKVLILVIFQLNESLCNKQCSIFLYFRNGKAQASQWLLCRWVQL